MLRVACLKVVPCAFSAVAASPRIISPRITNAFVSVANPRRSFSVQSMAFVSDKVVKALDSEIDLINLVNRRPAPPPNFTFKIEQSYPNHLILTRELDGEEIDVRVLDPVDAGNSTADNQNDNVVDGGSTTTDSDTDTDTDTDSDSDSYSDSTEVEEEEEKIEESPAKTPAKSVTLKVEVTKRNGKSLKFSVIASPDEIMIQRLTTKEGDRVICSQLYIKPDSELQMAFREFLEVRGIEKSIAGFLYDHMMWKSKVPYNMHSRAVEECSGRNDQEHVHKLSKLKEIIQSW